MAVARGGGFFGGVVIGECGAIGEMDRADFARRQRLAMFVADFQRAPYRAADRAGMSQPLVRTDRGEPVGFGPGVEFMNDRAQPVEHGPFHFDRAGRRRVKHDAQR